MFTLQAQALYLAIYYTLYIRIHTDLSAYRYITLRRALWSSHASVIVWMFLRVQREFERTSVGHIRIYISCVKA